MSKFQPRNVTAYRFMNNPEVNDSFLPAALVSPPADGMLTCEHWALSFFDSLNSAQNKFKQLNQRVDAKKKYGDHIGEIELIQADGLASLPNEKGHFSLHEELEAKVTGRIKRFIPL